MLNAWKPSGPSPRWGAASRWLLAAALLMCTWGAGNAWAAEGDEQAERIAVGQTAPSFELTGSDGQVYRLDDLKDKKSLVMVFFRGTW